MEVSFKLKKTKIMMFRKSGIIYCTWFYNENYIEMVNTFCYLGIVFFLGNPVTCSTTRQESVVLFKKQNKTLFKY